MLSFQTYFIHYHNESPASSDVIQQIIPNIISHPSKKHGQNMIITFREDKKKYFFMIIYGMHQIKKPQNGKKQKSLIFD